ncbi:AI-2E family transporter [Micromonospora sp. NPDC004540]|uniref:AI-2E family transporter n=1 Tax=Micromonospora sp. NPDC004540 TaxID=3154457 RepID=UPI0033A03D51
MALAVLAGLALVWAIRQVLAWLVVAVFLAVALDPLVNRVQRRLVRRRAAATLVVFLAGFLVLAVLGVIVVAPLLNELARFADRAPEVLREARGGRGPIGQLLERFHLRRYAEAHAGQFQQLGGRVGHSTVALIRGTVQGVAGTLTVVVLTYLVVVQGPRITARTLTLAGSRAEQLRRIGRGSARAPSPAT